MSRYIKKHRRQFLGVAFPLFFLFVLGSIGLSVFPGWINKSYGTPGQPCTSGDTTCDVCDGESCVFNDTVLPATFQCANIIFIGTTETTNFDPNITAPACPLVSSFQQQQPGCWTNCAETLTVSVATTIEVPVCSPSDLFCQGISGGDQTNACRTASCTTNSTFDSTNPSGCDYNFDSTAVSNNPPACILCSAPQPAGFTACGDGICEAGLGENCTSCPDDCLIPGFTDLCPLTSGPIIQSACQLPVPIKFVTFSSGPPFNDPLSLECEDGDLCTDNACSGGTTCTVTDKNCSLDVADFCCPAGCQPPATGQTCGNNTSCDVDCLPPVECPFCGNNIIDAGEACDGTAANNCGAAGCNNATCQCRPSFIGCLQGDGVFGKESSPGSCDGFSCSLNKDAGMPPAMNLWFLGLMAAGLSLGVCLRRRAE
jgi:hypothetical protein